MSGEYQNYEHQQYDSQQYEHTVNDPYYAYPATTPSHDDVAYPTTTGYDTGAGYDATVYDAAYNGAAAYSAAHNATAIGEYDPESYYSQTPAYNHSSVNTGAVNYAHDYELGNYGVDGASSYSPAPTKSLAPAVVAQRSRDSVVKPLNMKTKEVKRAVELGGGLDLFTKKGVNDENDLEGGNFASHWKMLDLRTHRTSFCVTLPQNHCQTMMMWSNSRSCGQNAANGHKKYCREKKKFLDRPPRLVRQI